jgi:hypothetical protein
MKGKSWLFLGVFVILLASGGFGYASMPDLFLRDNIGIEDVVGGDTTNPLWRSEIGNDEFRNAIKNSLSTAGFLERARGEGRYTLNATLESIDQSDVGSLIVTTQVRYTLVDRKTGRSVFQETIAAEYTMAMWDSLMRARRLRVACECAARANAGELAQKLSHLILSQEEVSSLR